MLFASGNGDDNSVLALSIEKDPDKIQFLLGEEETEVPPCCLLICLTLDGKLALFHFARYVDLVFLPWSR